VDEARLKSISLFEGLSKKERRRVAQCADEVDIREGKRLVAEGDFAYEFFVIEQGTAEVTNGRKRLAELGPGDFLGEMGVLERAPRNATVVATSPMTVIVMTGRDVRQIGREMPQVAQQITAAAERRAQAFMEKLPGA
jgi:CRP/FNR family transcriptional regulator, cyclic AMP receptor protein